MRRSLTNVCSKANQLGPSRPSSDALSFLGSSTLEPYWPKSEPVVAAGVTLGAPLSDDPSISSIATSIASLRSNIPHHIRDSLAPPPLTSSLSVESFGLRDRLKSLVSAPSVPSYPSVYIEPYRPGQIAAYHYPNVLVPRSVSKRIPSDLRVETPGWGGQSVNLSDKLIGRFSVIFTFSGEGYATPGSGVKQWRQVLREILDERDFYDIHFHSSWLSRRTHVLTRLLLKPEISNKTKTFIYRGKWSDSLSKTFLVYNKQLPSVLIVDTRGYIRWHSIGLPTDKCLNTLQPLLRKLLVEKN